MCTAVAYKGKTCFFGRNLDLEYFYDEAVTITSRNYELKFRKRDNIKSHFAIIGMAYVVDNYPLYYDGMNEKGLAMAGLSFPGYAKYKDIKNEKNESINNLKENITPFELIPYILGTCKNVDEAEQHIENMNIVDINFSEKLPLTPMHWIISDDKKSITVESVQNGINIYENPIGVLTNNPTFDYQIFNLNNYMKLSKSAPENRFSDELDLKIYSRGMGAMGLPGDLSSVSRFVRAAFVKSNLVIGDSKEEDISQFFHILSSVEQQKGCVEIEKGKYEYTIYSSCMDLERGIYYYKTYDNSQIIGVDMNKEDLSGADIKDYKILKKSQIYWQN